MERSVDIDLALLVGRETCRSGCFPGDCSSPKVHRESCKAMAASTTCGWVLEEAQPGVSSKKGSFPSVLTRQQQDG